MPPTSAHAEPETRERAERLLVGIAGAQATFRPGQWEAIVALIQRRRVLVVQRTGWGKSAVYLIATRLLREAGLGPTVIVSPLLVLMRNQIEMAQRAGVAAATINSANRDEWEQIEAGVEAGELDLLLVSPERLANDRFQRDVLPDLVASMGMLVVDEAHCISDWGHDFRPDYRRLARLARELPARVPVLATTATANDRVVADVADQLGTDIAIHRGSLDRPSLELQVIPMPDKADRLAWMAQVVPQLPGSGIVYSLTVRDAELVGNWLRSVGVDAAVYTGEMTPDDRLAIEESLRRGEVGVVSATSALGMGYDNPFIEFVIHFQSPGSPVAYYQQVGRAGRAVERAVGVLLAGSEDADIQDYFIDTAFPSEPITRRLLEAVAHEPSTAAELERVANLPRGRIQAGLRMLEVEGAVRREGSRWHRAAGAWEYPRERIEAVTAIRRREQELMARYNEGRECLLAVLRRALDDDQAAPCGRCSVCIGAPLLPTTIDPALRDRALRLLRRSWIAIPARSQAPGGLGIPSLRAHRNEAGRALCSWADPGWGAMVRECKQQRRPFPDELVDAARAMIEEWSPAPAPRWVTSIPNNGGSGLLQGFATRLAAGLGLPFVESVRRVESRPPQRGMENSFRQASNQVGAFVVAGCPTDPVLLVDDTVDSRWTFTVVGAQLRAQGVEAVHPVALADSSRGDG